MDTAKDLSISFHAVANYSAVAVRTNRRQRMDRTLKAIKGVMLVGTITSNALSYSFSQTSHLAIHKVFARRPVYGGAPLKNVTIFKGRSPAG